MGHEDNKQNKILFQNMARDSPESGLDDLFHIIAFTGIF